MEQVLKDIYKVENRIRLLLELLIAHFRDPFEKFCREIFSGVNPSSESLAIALDEVHASQVLFAGIDDHLKLSTSLCNTLDIGKISLNNFFNRFVEFKEVLIKYELNVERTRNVLKRLRSFRVFSVFLRACEIQCKMYSGTDQLNNYLTVVSNRFLYYKQILHVASNQISNNYCKENSKLLDALESVYKIASEISTEALKRFGQGRVNHIQRAYTIEDLNKVGRYYVKEGYLKKACADGRFGYDETWI